MDVPRDVAERAQRHEAWLAAVQAEPYRYDFYQAMRRIASAHPDLPPLGEALRPIDEPVRVGQPAELDFAPAALYSIVRRDGQPPRLMQRIFGLIGPNGALPLHLTEYARERARHHGDPTFQRFLDTFTHRFALLFYRAWAEAQLAVSLDRRGNKAYFNRLGSLVGIGLPSLQDRDELPDASKVYFAGRLARQTRDAEGLLSWIRSEFDVPVSIDQWCGHWMPLMRGERSRLGRRDGAVIGRSAVLGGSVWDVQHKFRITIGPLSLAVYRRFLPGGADLARLQALARHWVGIEFAWDVKLILARDEVPRFELGSTPVGSGAEPPAVAEGAYEAELVAVQRVDTEFGERVGLVFRIAAGAHQGIELTEAAAANVSLQGRIGELLRALAATRPGAESGAATMGAAGVQGGGGEPRAAFGATAAAGGLGASEAAAIAGSTSAADAASDDPAAARADAGPPAGVGAARAVTADTAVAAAAAAVADTAAAAGSDDGRGSVAIAVSFSTAHELIGRRCRIAVRHQRGADGRPRAVIGARTGLGFTTWLGRYLRARDADDLRLDVERPCAET